MEKKQGHSGDLDGICSASQQRCSQRLNFGAKPRVAATVTRLDVLRTHLFWTGLLGSPKGARLLWLERSAGPFLMLCNRTNNLLNCGIEGWITHRSFIQLHRLAQGGTCKFQARAVTRWLEETGPGKGTRKVAAATG